MKSTKLSSSRTFYVKFVLPVLVLLVSAAPLREFFNPDSPFPIFVKLFFLVSVFGFLGYALHRGHSLKSVSLVGEELHVSNYVQSERVHISEIDSVKIWRSGLDEIVDIFFANETKFGENIRFISYVRWPWSDPHPVVAMLHLEPTGSNKPADSTR